MGRCGREGVDNDSISDHNNIRLSISRGGQISRLRRAYPITSKILLHHAASPFRHHRRPETKEKPREGSRRRSIVLSPSGGDTEE